MTADWNRTSIQLSMFYNAHRRQNQPAKTPQDFNPMIEKKQSMVITKREARSLFTQLTEAIRR